MRASEPVCGEYLQIGQIDIVIHIRIKPAAVAAACFKPQSGQPVKVRIVDKAVRAGGILPILHLFLGFELACRWWLSV
jgi:hypothetical protein